MNSTAYSRMPLAQPSAAASATSCQVSKWCRGRREGRSGCHHALGGRGPSVRARRAPTPRCACRGTPRRPPSPRAKRAPWRCARRCPRSRRRRSAGARRRGSAPWTRPARADPPGAARPSSSLMRLSSSFGEHDVVHEADPERLGGVEALRRQEVAPRHPRADRLDHVGADRRRNKAELRLRQREGRLLRGDARYRSRRRVRRRRRTPRRGRARSSAWAAGSACAACPPAPSHRQGSRAWPKPAMCFIQFRSAPAQKLAPAPRSTTARTASSRRARAARASSRRSAFR